MSMNDQLSDSMTDNIPEFTVGDISTAIKRILEGNFSRVKVRGEVTELKQYPSGHIYFSLKDEQGKLTAIIWRFTAAKLKMQLENGIEIVATGKISSYGERSSYQLIVDQVDYAGEGAMLARIEKLRKKLEEEGLFAQERKRLIPLLPQTVGVITSPKGAVLHDIKTTIARRFPRDIIIWPVAVQGDGAAEQIALAIEGFNQFNSETQISRPDILIVARGGGSLEDLMAFNDERVVRAAANSQIPLISAVGHETDTTLIDFASDRRAPTPTAAAEMAVPSKADMIAGLMQYTTRLSKGLIHLNQAYRLQLNKAVAKLPDIPTLLAQSRMRLDDRSYRLDLALPALVMKRRHRLSAIKPVDQYVVGLIHRFKNYLEMNKMQMASSWRHYVQQQKSALPFFSVSTIKTLSREKTLRLEGLSARLEALSPHAVLSRGYVFVKDKHGNTVTQARKLRAGSELNLIFYDGEKTVRVVKEQDKRQEMLDI
ncbi:Exonuclease VII [Commensalibacter papalotli (ex Botero et al. 2024)]|uniref:Exodeoxyribonuclease 7 large subunit n=2 Tax=Commensalibacter papalotli (ex Botero et al. 2024) TaxID=2972766 RepID=A0ABM9HQX5_9PROT|nr:exodeoxyribonuclease VII large subunit [Commensalibacter papalotli (ex Botero et al. 2024)]CAI3943523.1 Exonuclease VII [Commensalibacter papalotli (ex Botero et al. 2024)]CAI3947373.1 Exonuclease VII [Commensalibacter papalotli (ex Botero et al. 2024)]